MTTITKTILPIAESIVRGTGNYTIPAGKYAIVTATGGIFQPSTSANRSEWTATTVEFGSSGSGLVKLECLEGQTINFAVTGTSANYNQNVSGNSFIVNGNNAQVRNLSPSYRINNAGSRVATVQTGFLTTRWQSNQNYNFNVNYNISVSLESSAQIAVFPIPKNNLPLALQE